MKTAYLCFPMLLALSLGAAETPGTDINPALLYYQSFLLAPDPIPSADLDYLYSAQGRSQKLPERFGPLAAKYDNQFKLVRQAARSGAACDWGLDATAGPGMLLPHLARAKAVTEAARLRVRWDLENNLQADAREDLLAALALGRNVARDGTLISVLVQIAIESIACNTIAENLGQFTPQNLEELARGLDSLPARKTVAESLPNEKKFFIEWFVRRIEKLQSASPGDEAKVMQGIRDLFQQGGEAGIAGDDRWRLLEQASGGTSAGVLRLLAEEERLGERLAAVAALPPKESEAQAKQFSVEIEKSNNPFAKEFLPAFQKARQREFRILVWLQMVRAAAQYKVNGTAAYRAVADPWGDGPFEFQRFQFQSADRGFKLTSAFEGSGYPERLIFVEKPGPAFHVDGPHVGEAYSK